MDFDEAELEVIERACRAQAACHRERATKMDRPLLRNQAQDAADALGRIVSKIESRRRTRAALAARSCAGCED